MLSSKSDGFRLEEVIENLTSSLVDSPVEKKEILHQFEAVSDKSVKATLIEFAIAINNHKGELEERELLDANYAALQSGLLLAATCSEENKPYLTAVINDATNTVETPSTQKFENLMNSAAMMLKQITPTDQITLIHFFKFYTAVFTLAAIGLGIFGVLTLPVGGALALGVAGFMVGCAAKTAKIAQDATLKLEKEPAVKAARSFQAASVKPNIVNCPTDIELSIFKKSTASNDANIASEEKVSLANIPKKT